MPDFVSALNSVDLPTFGRPTIPQRRLMSSFYLLLLAEQGTEEALLLRLWLWFRLRHGLGLRSWLGLGHRLGSFGLFLDRLGLLFLFHAMQFLHRALHVPGYALRQYLDAAADRLVDLRAILRRGLVQHVIGDRVLVAGVADPQAQAPIVVRTESLGNVLQAVVAGDAAALLDLRRARLEIKLVVHHEDLRRLDLEKAGQHLHRTAARVHETLRQDQPGAAAGNTRRHAAYERLVLAVLAQRDARLHGKALHQPEAGVVAGGGGVASPPFPAPEKWG